MKNKKVEMKNEKTTKMTNVMKVLKWLFSPDPQAYMHMYYMGYNMPY